MPRWLRQHPILTVLMVVGAVLVGSTLNAWIDGILGYVAYGACLVPAIAVVQLYFRREEH
jgi:hypothetical protein